MPNFHETIMGRRFYEADVPRFVKAVERIAEALSKLADAQAGARIVPVEDKCGAEVCCDDPTCPDRSKAG